MVCVLMRSLPFLVIVLFTQSEFLREGRLMIRQHRQRLLQTEKHTNNTHRTQLTYGGGSVRGVSG